MKINIFLFISLFLLSGSVFAEGGCPPGSYPANPPATNICYPFPENESSVPAQPQGRWQTRWGAIATDETVGTFGFAKNLASKQLASQAAITACKQNGGVRCEKQLSYYNQCAVVARGDTFYAARSEATIELASKRASQKCDSLTKNCSIVYADCSNAKWVSY